MVNMAYRTKYFGGQKLVILGKKETKQGYARGMANGAAGSPAHQIR